MAHIHTTPGHHDLTVTSVVVRLDPDEPRVLLHWHKTIQRWMDFGGHVELDENPWQALVRELQEESGYNLGQLVVLQPPDRLQGTPETEGIVHALPLAVRTVPYTDLPHKHIDLLYVVTTAEPPKHSIGQEESAKIKAFTRAEIMALPPQETLPSTRESALFVLDNCLGRWDSVPATNFLLY